MKYSDTKLVLGCIVGLPLFFVLAILVLLGLLQLRLLAHPEEFRGDEAEIYAEAARTGDIETVRSILERGRYVDYQYDMGRIKDGTSTYTALHFAIQGRHPEVVRLLLEYGANVNEPAGRGKHMPMDMAADGANFSCKSRILDLARKRNAPEPSFSSPERVAPLEIVHILVDHNPDLGRMQENGLFALRELARAGYMDTIVKFLSLEPDLSGAANAVAVAAGGGYRDIVEFLLAEGIDIAGKEGLLNPAAEYGRTEMIEFLLGRGVPLEEGLLERAAANSHLEAVRLLLDKGMTIQPDSEILVYALKADMEWHDKVRQQEKRDLVALLLSNSANPNVENEDGWTPLHLAVLEGFTPAVGFLVDHGANTDARTKKGDTPLHIAADTQGRTRQIQVLLQLGANPAIKNNDGKTPRDKAQEKERWGIVKILQEADNSRNTELVVEKD